MSPTSAKAKKDGGFAKATKTIAKPRRALTAYNFFFRSERAKMLGIAPPALDAASHEMKKKRKHRKTHGMMGFKEMSKQMSQKWSELDEKTKQKFQKMHEDDKRRYRDEMAAYYAKSCAPEASVVSPGNVVVGQFENRELAPSRRNTASPCVLSDHTDAMRQRIVSPASPVAEGVDALLQLHKDASPVLDRARFALHGDYPTIPSVHQLAARSNVDAQFYRRQQLQNAGFSLGLSRAEQAPAFPADIDASMIRRMQMMRERPHYGGAHYSGQSAMRKPMPVSSYLSSENLRLSRDMYSNPARQVAYPQEFPVNSVQSMGALSPNRPQKQPRVVYAMKLVPVYETENEVGRYML